MSPFRRRPASSSLKNAIDYLYAEWTEKPAGIVSYGGQVVMIPCRLSISSTDLSSR